MPGSTLEGLLGMLKDTFGGVIGRGGGGWQWKGEEEKSEVGDQISRGTDQHYDTPKGRILDQREGAEVQIQLEQATFHFSPVGTHFEGIKRRRRAIGAAPGTLVHLDNLHQLQRYWEMRRYCEDYLSGVAERNVESVISNISQPFQFLQVSE